MNLPAIGFTAIIVTVGFGVDYYNQSKASETDLGEISVASYIASISGRMAGDEKMETLEPEAVVQTVIEEPGAQASEVVKVVKVVKAQPATQPAEVVRRIGTGSNGIATCSSNGAFKSCKIGGG